MKICLRTVSITAAFILQLSVTVGASEGNGSTETVSKRAPPSTPSAGAARPISETEIDARVRKDVLDRLARELESRYVFEDTAKRLAELVRAKQRSNAYRSITTGPALARALTDDLLVVAHDKHLHVSFSFTPVPQDPSGRRVCLFTEH
jgi:hypothetical protein